MHTVPTCDDNQRNVLSALSSKDFPRAWALEPELRCIARRLISIDRSITPYHRVERQSVHLKTETGPGRIEDYSDDCGT
jgi:hypothetical protein